MDDLDRRLLNIIQTEFPIDPRPYQVLGAALGISEREALDRTGRLMEQGIIRKIGPSFDARKLGYVSTLMAAKVPAERLTEVAGIVSSYPEVTHNYGRDSLYNLWFTLICPGEYALAETIERVKRDTGIDEMYSLPSGRMYKIKVEFEF